MSSTTLTILDSTTFGTPSGNYDGSSLEWISDAAKGVGYYRGQGSLQTVTIQVTGFEGNINIEGSLDNSVTSTAWSSLYEYSNSSGVITDYHPVNLTGNFVWLRATITNFDAGVINSITVTY